MKEFLFLNLQRVSPQPHPTAPHPNVSTYLPTF